MNDTDVLELRKDIVMPGHYKRAGSRKTRAEWSALFPGLSRWQINEWFTDLTNNPPIMPQPNLKREIVNQVFASLGLHSMSYKEAAIKCLERYETLKAE